MVSTDARRTLVTALAFLGIAAAFAGLYRFMDPQLFRVAAVTGFGAAIVSIVPTYVSRQSSRHPWAAHAGLLALLLTLAVPVGYVATLTSWQVLTPLSAVLVTALTLVFFYYSVFLPLAFSTFSDEPSKIVRKPYPAVSIIVPAYNEEACIGTSIESLQRTAYQGEKEIVVVDDGSDDDTYDIAQEYAEESDTVTVVQKENGGKHSALNRGLQYASGDIILTVDADSVLRKDAVNRLVAAFQEDENVGAVAGNLSVANRGRFITALQELEYAVGIQLFRRAFDVTRTVVVVPGALGGFRRDVLDRVGGFDGDTLTEDRDATVKILKTRKTSRAVDAMCWTEAPETWTDLYRQRLRWYRGTVQTLWKHRDVFTNPRHGFLYSFAFPMEALSTLLVPIAGIAVVTSIALELLYGDPRQVLTLFAFFTLLQTAVSTLALRLGENDLSLAALSPLFVVGYRQFLDLVMLQSTLDVLTREDLRWTGPKRTGTFAQAVATVQQDVDRQDDAEAPADSIPASA